MKDKEYQELTKEEINKLAEVAQLVLGKETKKEILNSTEDIEEYYEDLLVEIASDIFAIRQKLKMTQKELGDISHKGQAMISKIENLTGDALSIKTLVDIFNSLGHKFYMTAYGDYTFTVPEEYRETVDKKATEAGLSTNEVIENSFNKGFEYYDISFESYRTFLNNQVDFTIKTEDILKTIVNCSPSVYNTGKVIELEVREEEFYDDFCGLNGVAQ